MMKRKKVNVYGAGKNADKYIPVLRDDFDIQSIFDTSQEKIGKKLHEIEIIAPTSESVNRYPVIILLRDLGSAHKTLEENGCRQEIFDAYIGQGRLFLFHKGKTISINSIVNGKEYLLEGNRDKYYEDFKIFENEVTEYRDDKPRFFDIVSSMEIRTSGGGPAAAWRHLRELNEKYRKIENFFSLCRGGAFVPIHAPVDETTKLPYKQLPLNTVEDLVRCEKDDPQSIFLLYYMLDDIAEFLYAMDARFHFNETDVVLLQDVWLTQVFLTLFPQVKKIVSASHTQGTIGSELAKSLPKMRRVYDALQTKHLQKISTWIFPSAGAREGFYKESTPDMQKSLDACDVRIVYNGYKRKEFNLPDEDFAEELEKMRGDADIMFATATYLYRHKGVEQIPRVLSLFREKTGLRIKWVLIGSGEMESDVEHAINENLLPEEVQWYHKRFDNQDNVFALFEAADFYIMMHRISVMDLSTLQAMAYGCVPFLSAVGGNKEFCAFHNGILVDPLSMDLNLDDYMSDKGFDYDYLKKMKESNSEIVRTRFSDEKWIDGYARVLYEKERD